MADPKSVEQKQAGDRKPSPAGEKGKGAGEEGAPAPAQGNNQLLTLIILAVAVVAGIASAFVLVKALAPAAGAGSGATEAKPGTKAEPQGKAAEGAPAKPKPAGAQGKSGGGEGKEGAKAETSETLFVFDKPIVVNLAETNAERFLKVSVVLDMEAAELRSEIESKQPKLLDLLINILSSKTLDAISTPAGRNMLRQEMIDKLNAQFESGRLVNIYFTEFVIQ